MFFYSVRKLLFTYFFKYWFFKIFIGSLKMTLPWIPVPQDPATQWCQQLFKCMPLHSFFLMLLLWIMRQLLGNKVWNLLMIQPFRNHMHPLGKVSITRCQHYFAWFELDKCYCQFASFKWIYKFLMVSIALKVSLIL